MSRFQDFLQPSLKAVQKKEAHLEKDLQSGNNTPQSETKNAEVSVQIHTLQFKDVFERLTSKTTESLLQRDARNKQTFEHSTIQIAEAPIPSHSFSTDLLVSQECGLITHDLATNDYAPVQKVYYVSDLHIEHQLRDIIEKEEWEYQELISVLDCKIKEMLSFVHYDDSIRYLLIGGDVGHSKVIVSLFYERLKLFWKSSIISVLGNHELWDDHPEVPNNSYVSSIDEITTDYRMIINDDRWNIKNNRYGFGAFLLQNALFVNYKHTNKGVIEEKKLRDATDEELRELCINSSLIILGGLGFSGLNDRFNATNGSYRSAVSSREEDAKLSKRFEELYDKLNRCASDLQVIVLTHTSVTDWLSKPVNPNWIYINGHTHHNSCVRKKRKMHDIIR